MGVKKINVGVRVGKRFNFANSDFDARNGVNSDAEMQRSRGSRFRGRLYLGGRAKALAHLCACARIFRRASTMRVGNGVRVGPQKAGVNLAKHKVSFEEAA